MPGIILYGGEIVVGLILLRIAVWFWRSRHDLRPPDPGPGGPPRGPGRPLLDPAPQAEVVALARPRAEEPPPLRRAA